MPIISISLSLPVAFYSFLAGASGHFLSFFAAFAQASAPAALVALWQGAAIAFVLALTLRLAPRVSAAHRFAVWTAAFAVVAALPFLPLLAHTASTSVAQFAPLNSHPVKPWFQFQLDGRWAFAVAALWLIASAYRAADLALHSLRLRRLLQTAVPVEVDPGLRALLASVSGSRRSVSICTTKELDRPSVIGFFTPRILIPDWLFEKLTPGELEHVVLHEAEHLRRGDDWTNLLQKMSLVLFPLNPALIWIERRLCREREMACDEGVVRRTQAPRAYAACLANLAERSLNRRAHALSLGAFGRRPELVSRVHSILWRKRTLHPLAARVWMGALGCGLLLSTVEFARCPKIIAFVPHHAVSTADAQPAAPSLENLRASNALDAETNPAASGIRMVDTKAILPDRTAAPRSRVATSRRPAGPQSEPAAQSQLASLGNAGSSRAVLLSAKSPEFTSAATPGSGQLAQLIVFTTWEQVPTTLHHSRRVADYDAGGDSLTVNSSADSQLSGAASPNAVAALASHAQPADRITVTQLILTVYPASSVPPSPKDTRNKMSSRTTNPKYGTPAAVPFDGGWLVFAL